MSKEPFFDKPLTSYTQFNQTRLMSTYAIGDIQGCYKTFRALLKRCEFDPQKDKLWIAGDLINRGPKSLEVLRYVKDLGDRAICVLGNHEIYLMALHLGVFHREDTRSLDPILKAKDSHELFDWIRQWPLMHQQKKFVLAHAGIFPCWSVQEAQKEANSIQKILQSDKIADFLAYAYSHQDDHWTGKQKGYERNALALHALVHMRMCANTNKLRYGYTGKPENAPKGLKAWYTIKNRPALSHTILFGHWSALGLRVFANCIALDSGCVWGEALSAYRLEDGAIFVEKSDED